MRKRIIPILIVVAIAAGGYWWWITYGPGNPAADGVLGGSGTVEAEQVIITPQASGRIIESPAEEGASVKKDDVLYKLDPALLQLAVDQAEAGVKAAKTNYEHVKDDSGSNKAERAAAKAQYEQAKVALEMAKVQLDYAVVKSPIDGILSNVAAKTGENAVPGSTLAIVSDTGHLTVTIYVPEDEIGLVKIGQAGEVTTDSTDKTYNAKVVFVATQAEFTPASIETKDQRVKLVYQVKLALTDSDAALKPGMPADVVLK